MLLLRYLLVGISQNFFVITEFFFFLLKLRKQFASKFLLTRLLLDIDHLLTENAKTMFSLKEQHTWGLSKRNGSNHLVFLFIYLFIYLFYR